MTVKTQPLKAFDFRHACKVMDANQKIPAATFNTILEAGRLSPSSFGYEPWRFLVVQNTELREKLKAQTWGAQNTLPQSSHFVMILARTAKSMRYDSDYIQYMMQDIHHLSPEHIEKRKGFYETFQRSDFNLLDDERAMWDWASKQTYIALANMMTVAAQLEVDSCPVEGFKQAEVNALLASDFGIDTTEFQVSVMVAFGYRVNPQNPKTRQPMADICEWFE
ncbi:MAG: NAD(P)H-dependent oxidoreductase [Thiotrichales bacterium]|nr:NAD(P)H-dependent oxidoreductase [Thiotrichales bacterium]